jgi:hypothetical protein
MAGSCFVKIGCNDSSKYLPSTSFKQVSNAAEHFAICLVPAGRPTAPRNGDESGRIASHKNCLFWTVTTYSGCMLVSWP